MYSKCITHMKKENNFKENNFHFLTLQSTNIIYLQLYNKIIQIRIYNNPLKCTLNLVYKSKISVNNIILKFKYNL